MRRFDRPMLIVTLARPELLEQRPGWGAEPPQLLEPASRPADRRRDHPAAGRPGPRPRPRRSWRAWSDAPTASRSMRSRSHACLKAAGQDGPPASSDEALPTSLHALIAARIDGLGEVERSLLMSAAVLGRRFTTAALAAVAGGRPGGERVRSVERTASTGDAHPRPGRPHGSSGPARISGAAGPGCCLSDPSPRRAAAAGICAQPITWRAWTTRSSSSGGRSPAQGVPDRPAHPQAAAIADRARPALVRAARRARALHAPRSGARAPRRRAVHGRRGAERASILEDAAAAAQVAGSFEVAERDLRLARCSFAKRLGDRAGAARASAQAGRPVPRDAAQ